MTTKINSDNKGTLDDIYTKNFSVRGLCGVASGLVAGVANTIFSVSKLVQTQKGPTASAAKSFKAVGWGLSASVGSIILAGVVGYAVYSNFPSSGSATNKDAQNENK